MSDESILSIEAGAESSLVKAMTGVARTEVQIMMNLTSLLTSLQSLEVELHHPGVRCNRERLEQLLHPDFHEVGRSGRAYDRDTVVKHLASQASPPSVASDAFDVLELGPDSALLTYRSVHVGDDGRRHHHTLRSSIWVQTQAGWQLRYHQGTPALETW